MFQYLASSLAIVFMSWIVGIIAHALLRKTSIYCVMSRLQYAPSPRLYKLLGLPYFKWLVIHTPVKLFNQNLKISSRKDLQRIYSLMTSAELSHLLGFIFVVFMAIYKGITLNFRYGLVLMILNILLNLYPALLQQYNKQRIIKILNYQVKT